MTQDCLDGSDESDCSEYYPPPPIPIKWCPLPLLLSSSEDNNNQEVLLCNI